MTISTFSNLTVNTLADLKITAGGYNELNFYCYNTGGSPLDISSASCSWNLSTYSTPHTIILQKSGSVTVSGSVNNRFTVPLYSADTAGLSGKYFQQPIVVSVPGYTYAQDQGVVTIIP